MTKFKLIKLDGIINSFRSKRSKKRRRRKKRDYYSYFLFFLFACSVCFLSDQVNGFDFPPIRILFAPNALPFYIEEIVSINPRQMKASPSTDSSLMDETYLRRLF